MKLTKEDYMRLKKERLAELLVELTSKPETITTPSPNTTLPPTPNNRWCIYAGGNCKHSGGCISCPYKEPQARLANNTSIDTSNEQPYHP